MTKLQARAQHNHNFRDVLQEITHHCRPISTKHDTRDSPVDYSVPSDPWGQTTIVQMPCSSSEHLSPQPHPAKRGVKHLRSARRHGPIVGQARSPVSQNVNGWVRVTGPRVRSETEGGGRPSELIQMRHDGPGS